MREKSHQRRVGVVLPASLQVLDPVPVLGGGLALWVTSLTDPDGYRIDFESPTDVPEDTKLSDSER